MIIIHLGTNDIEKVENTDDITKNLVNLGNFAKMTNPGAEVVISEIPVRNDYINERRSIVNNLLKRSLPESLNLVVHENVTTDMLYDKKHIKQNCINFVVKNMKNKLRELITYKKDSNRISKNHKEEQDDQNQQIQGKNFQEILFNKKIDSLMQFLTSVRQNGGVVVNNV